MRDGFSRRAQDAFARQWVLFIRQSTMHQRMANVGSGDVQAQQVRTMERMNVKPEQIVTIDARGESGRAEVIRHFFEQLVRLLATGLIGVLVLARFDRIGRNKSDTERVLRLLAQHGGMLLIDGRIYDPREPTDQLSLGMQSAFAEYENLARARWMMLARLEMARQLKTGIPLPTSLIWANPNHAAFRARLVSAGLGEWLGRLGEHRSSSGREPSKKYVFPYPDREVYDSARLRLDWMFETQDLAAVRDRIRDPSSGWPRPGLVPIIRTSVYSPDTAPQWIPVEHSELDAWYRSPALYSIYAYSAMSLAEADDLPVSEFSVWEPRAFPSFAEPEDLEQIESFLSRAQSKPWKSQQEEREHLLPNVRCAQPRDDGTPCGRHLTSAGSGSERRYSTVCRHSAPHGTASQQIEEPVLEVLLAAIRPEEIQTAVETLRRDGDAALVRRNAAQTHCDRLKAQAAAALDLVIEARAGGQTEVVPTYMERHRDLAVQAAAAERKLEALRVEEAQIRAVTDADYARVVALAGNLPRLVEDARANPEVLRNLVGVLTSAVHVRPLAFGVVQVEVEFPTGVRVRRIVETFPTKSTQPQRLYAAQRLAGGASAVEVADELNRALKAVFERAPSTPRLNARRVGTMAAMHVHGGDVPPREGAALNALELATRYGVTEEQAQEAILLGSLGPASWTSGDTLAVVPTSEEEVWVFVEWTRRVVAEQRGWPLDETLTVVEAVEALSLSRDDVLRNAGRCSGATALPARRLWVRRSEAEDPEAALRARLQELRPDLDPGWWVPCADAAEREGWSKDIVKKHFPVVRPGYGPSGEKSVYVWLHPELPRPERFPTLAAAVQALGDEYDPDDFVAVSVLGADLSSRFGVGGQWALQSAASDGRIVSIRAARSGRGSRFTQYVLVPPEVRNAACAEDVLAWLGRPSH